MNFAPAVGALFPPGVVTVTDTLPAVSALGASTVSCVADSTDSPEPATVPNETALAPVRFVPVTVTRVPPASGPIDGLTALTVGAATPVTARAEVAAAAAVAVGTTESRKYHRPCPGIEYFAVRAPEPVVVVVETVDHDVDEEGLRCTRTARAAYPDPVLTETASVITDPTGPRTAVVDQPDTAVLRPLTPVTLRLLVTAEEAVDVLGT